MSKKMFELIISLMKKCQLTEEKIRKDFGLSTAEYNGLLAINKDEKMLSHLEKSFAEMGANVIVPKL